jgi:hypothetical protein
MARTVVLHIGAMKSGTSFIQHVLGGNRGVLAEQGFLFPGSTWRKQVLGVLDVLGQTRDGKVVEGSPGAWQRLLDEMERWPGTAVVSMEFLGPTPVADISRVVESLAPAEVQVVMTARDLGRNIPAMWQEAIKNGTSWEWGEYVGSLAGGAGGAGGDADDVHARRFWRQMDYPRIARRWARVVGKDRFTLLTVPHPGAPAGLLWERFCSVVGLDPVQFELPGRSNPSLGAASALVLRALNEALPEDLPLTRYQHVVKHRLARDGLSGRAGTEAPIGFTAPWVADRTAEQVARLEQLGVTVVGDLEELRPAPAPGADPSDVPVEEQLEAAVAALAYLVEVWPSP